MIQTTSEAMCRAEDIQQELHGMSKAIKETRELEGKPFDYADAVVVFMCLRLATLEIEIEKLKKSTTMSNENKSLTPDIKPMLDEAYNTAIEHAIDIVKGMGGGAEVATLMEIESKLQQLKKK